MPWFGGLCWKSLHLTILDKLVGSFRCHEHLQSCSVLGLVWGTWATAPEQDNKRGRWWVTIWINITARFLQQSRHDPSGKTSLAPEDGAVVSQSTLALKTCAPAVAKKKNDCHPDLRAVDVTTWCAQICAVWGAVWGYAMDIPNHATHGFYTESMQESRQCTIREVFFVYRVSVWWITDTHCYHMQCLPLNDFIPSENSAWKTHNFQSCCPCCRDHGGCWARKCHGDPTAQWCTMRGVDFTDYGGFQKCCYPQIIHSNRVSPYKASILGYPHLWKQPS